MKNKLKKLLIIGSLALCAAQSFGATQKLIDGGSMSNYDDFEVEYKNNTHQPFYFDNDQGNDGVLFNGPDKFFYAGHGYIPPNGAHEFLTALHTTWFSKGAKKQVFLYIPLTSGPNKGKYKKVSFMLWSPHSGNPSWKLGTCNMGNPMEEDDYCNYYYTYENYLEDQTSSIGIGGYRWGLVQVELDQDQGGEPYLKINAIDDSSEKFDGDKSKRRIINSQSISTGWVRGDIVTKDQLPEAQMHAIATGENNKVLDIPAPKGTYDFGQWKAGEYPVVYSPKEIHPFVTYNGKGYVACNGDTTAKDVPGKSDVWKEVNGSLGNTCGYTVHSYKKQSTTPSVAKSAVSFW